MTISARRILVFNLLYLALFAIFSVMQGNIEFLFYISIVVFFLVLLILMHEKLGLSKGTLWGLSAWGLLHMMGGLLPVNGSVLYNLQLIPVFLKYDQLVHAFGFGITTLVGWQLLHPYLQEKYNRTTIAILLVMIGMGAGSLNEILEFVATVTIPETNVGGYTNTSLDMVFNMLGSVVSAILISMRQRR